jgi:16S rRNA (cytosine967-C5)-methyltransferase
VGAEETVRGIQLAGLDVRDQLSAVYGPRLFRVLEAIVSMGPRYYFRLNSLVSPPSVTVEDMRLEGLDVSTHERLEDAAFIPVRESSIQPVGMLVEADRFAAESVLQGAHLYAKGVRRCHGLKRGSEASVMDPRGNLAGTGVARQSETGVLTYRQGVAVEVTRNRFGLPSLMDTQWYEKGQIYLQSLPAMLTCHVLDPRPGETVVDLNCAPGGKMSYLCQLTENKARIIGFDRKQRKLDKTRKQLERLNCRSYQLFSHDSRYIDVDYSLKADKVLVDPPCTGLGVTPKLSVDTTSSDVKNLARYQKQFLTAASHTVKPGGTVVYSVCTITRAECEEAVEFATNELGLVLEDATPMLGRPGDDEEHLTQRFDPDLHGFGYFIAKFAKKQ